MDKSYRVLIFWLFVYYYVSSSNSNTICLQNSYSYLQHGDEIDFIDNPSYFIISKSLYKDGNYITPETDAGHASRDVLNVKTKETSITALPTEEALCKLNLATQIGVKNYPVVSIFVYPSVKQSKDTLITIKASDITVRELLDRICKQSVWSYRPTSPYIIFSNGLQPPPPHTLPPGRQPQ